MNVHCPCTLRYMLDLTVKLWMFSQRCIQDPWWASPRGPDWPDVLVKTSGIIQQIQFWSWGPRHRFYLQLSCCTSTRMWWVSYIWCHCMSFLQDPEKKKKRMETRFSLCRRSLKQMTQLSCWIEWVANQNSSGPVGTKIFLQSLHPLRMMGMNLQGINLFLFVSSRIAVNVCSNVHC